MAALMFFAAFITDFSSSRREITFAAGSLPSRSSISSEIFLRPPPSRLSDDYSYSQLVSEFCPPSRREFRFSVFLFSPGYAGAFLSD